jgi:sporulation protein YlmC with PRC-barrel domain
MRGKDSVRSSQLINRPVWTEDFEVGTVKDVIVDTAEWKVTHLEVQLRKEASKEILGAKKSFRNLLAVSALKKEPDCCSVRGVELQATKAQLRIYLKPP